MLLTTPLGRENEASITILPFVFLVTHTYFYFFIFILVVQTLAILP
jgi:hypothetical protein